MCMSRFMVSWIAIISLLCVGKAHAYFDTPWITPANPLPGQEVFVNMAGGYCDTVAERPGYPVVARDGNLVEFLEYGNHFEPGDELCVYPPYWTVSRSIGTFAEGDFILIVSLAYDNPPFGMATMQLGTIRFAVKAPTIAAPVPTVGAFAIGTLLFGLCALAVWRLRKTSVLFIFIALSCVPLQGRAQDAVPIQLLLTNAPGAPLPAQVISWVQASKRTAMPPLAAFNIKTPLAGNYLIPDRAAGDFLAWLDLNPHSARKKLEDYVVVSFAAADIPVALAALQADPYVAAAFLAPDYDFAGVGLIHFEITPGGPAAADDQYGWFAMNLDAAWRLASGYALIGQIDMGLHEQHAALRQFTDSTWIGGNFVKAASRDVSLTAQPAQAGFDASDVDEKKSMWIGAGSCTATGGFLSPAILGHGTHVAGLLAANGASALGVQGTCKHCGISAWKVAYLECTGGPKVTPKFNSSAADRAQAQSVDIGAQVLSQSYGAPNPTGTTRCATHAYLPTCLSIDYAMGRDVVTVAASGNTRQALNFPASEPRVVSAGGFQHDRTFWDESPGNSTNCPAPPMTAQCGSNFSKATAGFHRTHQEVLGSARRVLSTTYPNTTWVDYAECGDGYGTPMGDGIGWCTGTSMAAPQIAGAIGLLRSINPLVPQGRPVTAAGEAMGVRTVLAQTASQGSAWDPKLGHGIPDVAQAARRMLGTTAGATARNRVTPLFRLHQATARDFAETSSPQYALSLLINQTKNYLQPATGLGAQPASVPSYAFPHAAYDPANPNAPYDSTPPPIARAAIYVLTTEHRPRSKWPELRPLHLMSRNKVNGKDHLLATTKSEIETAHAAGYDLRTIQGYIFQPCAPESVCIPPAAERLWRKSKGTDADCAVFLESERIAFEAAGYTATCPTGGATMIGYAYPATDSDGDGLPDGFEYVVGTDSQSADSDGDGVPDGIEFPLAGVAIDDPCMGGSFGASRCGADRIFDDGFDGF